MSVDSTAVTCSAGPVQIIVGQHVRTARARALTQRGGWGRWGGGLDDVRVCVCVLCVCACGSAERNGPGVGVQRHAHGVR